MDIPWKTDKVSVKAFSVNTLYDLNMDPQAKVRLKERGQVFVCNGLVVLLSDSLYYFFFPSCVSC